MLKAKLHCWIDGTPWVEKIKSESILGLKNEALLFLKNNTTRGDSSGELVLKGKVIMNPHFSLKKNGKPQA